MSEPRREIAADEVDMRAAAWLERRDCENWGEADQATLDAWLAQSLAHRVAYWRLKDAWTRTERISVLRGAPAPIREKHSAFFKMFGRGAAIVCAVLVSGALIYKYAYSPNDEWTYSTPLGGHETVRLGDGSQVELNTDTVIRVANEANPRKIWLDKGEAYFQIKHDAGRPLTVMTRGYRIVDLGTKFLVRQEDDRLEVSLVEGRARFEAVNGSQTRASVLKPGDSVIATASGVSFKKQSAPALDATLSWRRDVLMFDHTTLADAAREFNRYNREKLVIADSTIAVRTVGGTFPKNGLADFADVMKSMLKLRVSRIGDEIVISR